MSETFEQTAALSMEQKNYDRLRESIQKGVGILLPEYQTKQAAPILKFLKSHADEHVSTGRVLSEKRSVDDILRHSAQAPEANIFVQHLNKICNGIDTKSVHVLSSELKHLHNTIKLTVKK